MQMLQTNPPIPSRELIRLSLRLAELNVHRLREILDRSARKDAPLRKFLRDFISEAERDVGATALYARREKAERREERIRFVELVRRHLPSTRAWFGEGPLDREAALHFVEALFQEVSRCWLMLGGAATEREPRGFLENMSERAQGRLDHVRTAVLGRGRG